MIIKITKQKAIPLIINRTPRGTKRHFTPNNINLNKYLNTVHVRVYRLLPIVNFDTTYLIFYRSCYLA